MSVILLSAWLLSSDQLSAGILSAGLLSAGLLSPGILAVCRSPSVGLLSAERICATASACPRYVHLKKLMSLSLWDRTVSTEHQMIYKHFNIIVH